MFWAVVAGDGTFNRGSAGVTSLKLPGNGVYEVDFGTDVTGCGYVGTTGGVGAAEANTGFLGTASRLENAEAVFLAVENEAGTLTDTPFHLIVIC